MHIEHFPIKPMKSHLISGIGSKTVAVIFHSDFDVLSGALPTPAQALPSGRKARMYRIVFTTMSWWIKRETVSVCGVGGGASQDSPRPWTSPFAPASSGQTWSHPCSRRCSWGPRTTSVSYGLRTKQRHRRYVILTQKVDWHNVKGKRRNVCLISVLAVSYTRT